MLLSRARQFALASAVAVLAACGGGGDGGGTTNPPAVGGFSVALSSTTLSMAQGASGSVTANITRTGSFTGTVDLSTENVPSGLTATFNPASITSSTTSTTLTVSATASVAAGNYSFTIRGKATGQSDQTATVTVTVTAAPAIALVITPAAGSVVQGGSAAIATTVTRTNYTGAVALAVTGAPTGVTTTVAANGDAGTVTVNVGAAATPGTSTLTVTASGTGVANATATYALTVTAAPTGSYTVALSPSTLSIQQGATAQSTVNITRTNFTAPIALTVSGAPTGVTTAFGQSTLNTETSTTLTVNVGAAVAAGNYPLTVTATSGTTTQTAALTLTVTAAPAGTIALTLSPASATVTQGGNASFAVNIARTNFTGSVTLAVSGAPNGVTTAVTTSPTAGNSANVAVTVGASVAAGVYPLVVTGSAAGIANATATYNLTVTAAPVGSGNVSWTFGFCGNTDVPIWVAAQDGNGPWQRVVGNNNTYAFTITNSGAIAYVTQNAGNDYDINFYYGTLAEMQSRGTTICPTAATKTVNGTVANFGTSTMAQIALGGASATVTSPATAFTLTNVAGGNVDLVAARQGIDFTNPLAGLQTNKLIIRRNLNPAAGSTLPVLDFNAAEAFNPVTNTLTINGAAGGETLVASTTYFTANQGFAVLGQSLPSGNTATIVGVPSAQQVSTDLHILNAFATNVAGGSTATSTRLATVVYKDAANKTVTLGSALSAPTVTSAATAPYLRTRVQLARQAEYDKYWVIGYGQTGRSVAVQYTAAYLGSNAIDFTFPDFSALAGWQNTWAPVTGALSIWNVSASGWSITTGGFSNPYLEGALILTGARTGQFTP